MAKEKLNQIKKPKKPLREVLFQSLKKLIYLLIVLSIAGLIYLINNSKLFEPSIAWEINSDFENLTQEYDDLEDEQLKLIYAAIYRLNDIEKGIIFLYLENKNYREISETLGISEVNARVRMNRIKTKLKTQLTS